jgi:hypothetical protein
VAGAWVESQPQHRLCCLMILTVSHNYCKSLQSFFLTPIATVFTPSNLLLQISYSVDTGDFLQRAERDADLSLNM